MNRKYIYIGAAVIILAALGLVLMNWAEKPAAIVNGQAISEEELSKAISLRSTLHEGTGANVTPEALRSSVLEQLISDVLILQGAIEAGVAVTDEELAAELDSIKKRNGPEAFGKYLKSNSLTEVAFMARLRESMIKNRFVKEFIIDGEVPEEEIREFYRESPMPFMAPETVEVRIVEFATMEASEAAIKKMRSIKKGGFDKVADSLMKDNTAFVSEYGETTPSFYPGEVGRAMKELPEGAFGGPYSGKDGFFIVRVRKRIPERPRKFEEARDEISAMLHERRKSASIVHWVANRRNTSTIVRN